MEQITIKLPPKMLKEFRELSDKSYNPISFHIRQSIAEYSEIHNEFTLNIHRFMTMMKCLKK
ncbi:ribbon-helix-helix domain-containing protein [uncultured Methanobacterium sp.]|uniref:ribbon-helix-helix domain-containing protein n=1 Tax=uncultured Methanobacterium sp. TaxID=176306 RepID=UPI0037490A6B